ncbi:MAG TPA: AAA family ATPase [Actinomycetota bacterium]|nr:AAA family ATPase [Actinomycetota bacterium]
MPEALLITGTIGAGKTTVAKAIGELLGARGIPTAVIDLDWLGWVHAVEKPPAKLISENLASMWTTLRGHGVERIVMARAVRTLPEITAIQDAVSPAALRVVRLEASAETIYERLRARDTGAELEEHLAQVPTFSAELDAAGLEELTISSEGAPADVAAMMIDALVWA